MSDHELLLKVGRRIKDFTGLPPEVIKEINRRQKGDFNTKVITIIQEDFGGMANIDEIIVNLYRRFQIIVKRSVLSARLYKMTKNGWIFRVVGAGKQGIYSAKTTDKI